MINVFFPSPQPQEILTCKFWKFIISIGLNGLNGLHMKVKEKHIKFKGKVFK